jgi:AcrR family transcriptional regulator
MSKAPAPNEWREARRQSARDAIVDAAWALVREEGLAALTLRDLAKRARITTPTVYAYFDSKHAIYDAMFGQAATVFADLSTELESTAGVDDDPHRLFAARMRQFVDFCTSDVARYQLLFQRTIPGFEPSPESYAPAVRSIEALRARFARHGITDPRHLDMWTAMLTGLVDQQISNDPGGDRWSRLIDDCVAMFLAYCQPAKPGTKSATKSNRTQKTPTTKGARP